MTAPDFIKARPGSGTPGIQFFDGVADDDALLVWIAPGGRPYNATLMNHAGTAVDIEATASPIAMVEDGTAIYEPLISVPANKIENEALDDVLCTAMRFQTSGEASNFTLGVAVRV